MKISRIFALLLAVIMLLSTFTGCNTTEPDITDPSGSVGTGEHVGSDETGTTNGTTDTTTGTEEPTGTTGSDPAGNETISGTETTEPNNPTTNPSTQPSGCNHNWSDWTVKKEATCTADGSEERTCSKCGEKEQRAATTGHTMGSWYTTKKATCDANGVKTRKCSKCGHEETQTIAATGHNWDSGKVTTTPTSCSDMGIRTYTCKACGRTKTEQIKGSHTFGEWTYEEYDWTNEYGGVQVSHRKVRVCTKCGYKETDGTPGHYCAKGSSNHTVTTVKEGTCTTKATMRSTCKICGWYVEYEGKKGSHTIVDKEVHLSDYGAYTNELDATISECTSCGTKSVVYHKGQGWSDYNRYYAALNISTGSSATPVIPTNDNFAHVDHPTWQTVQRDFVYDSDGYVKQFTLYWWYNGSRYSQVIKCGKGEIEAWFAQYGLTGGANSGYTIRIYGTEVRPYSVGSSG